MPIHSLQRLGAMAASSATYYRANSTMSIMKTPTIGCLSMSEAPDV
jgi:hypothetical protein